VEFRSWERGKILLPAAEKRKLIFICWPVADAFARRPLSAVWRDGETASARWALESLFPQAAVDRGLARRLDRSI